MKFILNYIRKEEWSPYVAGVLLGLVGIATVWASDTLLGASGAFENLAGMLGKALHIPAFENIYFGISGTSIVGVMPPYNPKMLFDIPFGLWLLIGVFFGGMIGAATSGTLMWGKKGAANSDAQWKRIFGPQVWKRWVLAFFGAIILEYAAGIAGGCTSGLAISGGMLLAPAAFLFIMGMFASGIVTALIVYRKNY